MAIWLANSLSGCTGTSMTTTTHVLIFTQWNYITGGEEKQMPSNEKKYNRTYIASWELALPEVVTCFVPNTDLTNTENPPPRLQHMFIDIHLLSHTHQFCVSHTTATAAQHSRITKNKHSFQSLHPIMPLGIVTTYHKNKTLNIHDTPFRKQSGSGRLLEENLSGLLPLPRPFGGTHRLRPPSNVKIPTASSTHRRRDAIADMHEHEGTSQ